MKIGIVIVDGVGYRNFILSTFLKKLASKFETVYIYTTLPEQVFENDLFDNVVLRHIKEQPESKWGWFYRKWKEVAHLRMHRDFFGMNDRFKRGYPKKIKYLRSFLIRVIYLLTYFWKSEKVIKRLEKKQLKTYNEKDLAPLKTTVKEDDPQLLFFTHQRPPSIVPLCRIANELHIKTATFIFSWDNLPSKGRMAYTFNDYFVWSDDMKNDLKYFYPNVAEDTIHVIGTPQFEPYILDHYPLSKIQFSEKFTLDQNIKTICYSCGDISTSKNDVLYIETIANAIASNAISEKVNFIVRTSPAEDETRFLETFKKFDFIKWNFPEWDNLTAISATEQWTQRIPTKKDVIDLKNLLHYCDIGINMCSTMSLDFMLFEKPIINPVFGNEANGLYNDQRYLKFKHYENVVNSGAVFIAKNEKELIEEINLLLADPLVRKDKQEKLVTQVIGRPLNSTTDTFVTALYESLN